MLMGEEDFTPLKFQLRFGGHNKDIKSIKISYPLLLLPSEDPVIKPDFSLTDFYAL